MGNRKMQLSENGLAYLMVLPAMIIIFMIALWPVIRSFWYSMFELQLNHPTKNAVHLKYQLDVERYVDTQFYINSSFKTLAKSVEESKANEVTAIKAQLDTLHNNLMKLDGFSSRYETVKDLLDSFKPVNDEKIRYFSISKKTAQQYLNTIAEVTEQLQKLSEKSDDPAKETASIMEDLRVSILKPNFVGFDNYLYYLDELKIRNGELGRLGKALINTFSFTFVSVFLELILGLGIALLINKSFKGRGLVRAAILVPWAIPTVVSAMMWQFLYDGQTGIVSAFFAKLGLVKNPGILLTTKGGAFFSIVFADVWKTTPYMALLLLAGLQTISAELYEAGQVDGATKIQQFFKITLPLLKPTILVALLFRTLDAFRIFDLVYVLTGGGPANSTETISVYAYKTMFAQMDFGRGSTLSIVVFICISLISIGYIKLLGADILRGQDK
ncbi:MAG: carbohydrate transporter rane protein 1, family [Clostridia bacterium]|jgi:multiple sugar transport system permease protein|uniref:carbohydrate ABC transporter permease n=1 Tax=Petroclostridium xylanilyticum TaxID=1792311 RepID=UPI000B98DAB1|nr:sugar ABC transporter permease [Petroclostridium xylanilyticum]MBZ4646856.1 carbohydrate transporter rane protein 1, family [Clostridia bacterium]